MILRMDNISLAETKKAFAGRWGEGGGKIKHRYPCKSKSLYEGWRSPVFNQSQIIKSPPKNK